MGSDVFEPEENGSRKKEKDRSEHALPLTAADLQSVCVTLSFVGGQPAADRGQARWPARLTQRQNNRTHKLSQDQGRCTVTIPFLRGVYTAREDVEMRVLLQLCATEGDGRPPTLPCNTMRRVRSLDMAVCSRKTKRERNTTRPAHGIGADCLSQIACGYPICVAPPHHDKSDSPSRPSATPQPAHRFTHGVFGGARD